MGGHAVTQSPHKNLDAADYAAAVHAVGPVRFSHKSPFVNERTQQCPRAFITHRGGEGQWQWRCKGEAQTR